MKFGYYRICANAMLPIKWCKVWPESASTSILCVFYIVAAKSLMSLGKCADSPEPLSLYHVIKIKIQCPVSVNCFCLFYSVRPINNLSVIYGRVFLG